jgi:ribonuclease R
LAGSKRGGKGARKAPAATSPSRGLPDRRELLEFIQNAEQKVGKREIARAFGIRGTDRVALKDLLRELADEGLIEGRRKSITRQGVLPAVTVLEITHMDDEGELIARPQKWDGDGEPPLVLVQADRGGRGTREETAGVGHRILARIDERPEGDEDAYPYRARILKVLPKDDRELLGIFRRLEDGSGIIDPVDRKILREWVVSARDCEKTRNGDLVRFIPARPHGHGPLTARITAELGNPDRQNAISLIAIHRHGIPDSFPRKALDELEHLPPLGLAGRADLRALPLVTIDPFDARDHDDAVYACPDDSEDNAGGHKVVVAIADVAHYVRPGTALDREAQLRGNSVYFPDRVVPMLPELISNNLCSLRENEERPCLAVEMRFDADGNKLGHKFMRAVMRSRAKLAYQQAQRAIDGQPDEVTVPLLEPVLQPLWRAFRALMKERARRHPLDLELPERKIIMNDEGRIEDIVIPERLDAHRVIEEFMIQANVSAAQLLDKLKTPQIYRVHAPPSADKMVALADFLQTLDIRFPRNARISGRQLNDVLHKVAGRDIDQLVNETILRSQSQAEYSIRNDGHFGLNLRQYAHFTSPIRRYADLVVHRALIRALQFGDGALTDAEIGRMDKVAMSISDLERRAMAAERETVDRLIAYHLADHIGATFAGRISGVTRSGLFVRLSDTGADGFIPAATIGREYYYHDEAHQALIGEDTGETFRIGMSVTVRLIEVVPTAGALRFEMLSRGMALPKTAKGREKSRGKPKGGRR